MRDSFLRATHFLNRAEGRLSYDISGDGPLVVCVPGMGDLRASYRFVIPRLVEAGYRVATLDLRGLGASSTGWDSHSQIAMASDIIALIRQLGGPAVVVGHSYTPDSAIAAAVEAPGDVTGTVLLAPWARRPAQSAFMRWATRLVTSSSRLWAAFYKSLYKGAKPVDFRAYLAALRANLREPGRMAAVTATALEEAIDATGQRARCRQPALIVMGRKDPDFQNPEAEAAAMAAALAGPSKVVMVDDAGHYPHAQVPEETATAIVAFLRELGHA